MNHPVSPLSRQLSRALVLLLGLAGLGLSGQAAAQSCWVSGPGGLAFGSVSPDAQTDTQTSVAYTCQSNANPTYFRVCMFIADGSPIAGNNPRYMTNNNGAQMAYNIYADPARTQVIGPPPSGGGSPVVTAAITVPAAFVQNINTLPLYGRVPANQNLPATYGFQTQLGGSALYWAWSNSTMPTSCMTAGMGGSNGNVDFYTSATATVSNACRISLSTDLDFGTAGGLTANRDQTSAIVVRCPTGTAWRLGLNNGSHASGNTRRMRSGAGNFIPYELYKNAARTQRWGNTPGTDTSDGTGAGDLNPQSQTVYGRVPQQASAQAGSYVDTVTITLTY